VIALVVFISVLVLVAAYLTYGRFLALSFSLLALAVWLKHSGRRIGFMLLPLAVMLVLSLFLLIETLQCYNFLSII